MHKPEIASAIAKALDLSKERGAEILNVLLDEIGYALAKGDDVSILGFGRFEAKLRAARTGHNPKTGEVLTVPEHHVVVFRAGKKLKEAVQTDQS